MTPHTTSLDEIKRLVERGQPDEALTPCRALAEAGAADAQLYLGWLHQAGKGVPRSLEEADRWYSRAIRPESGKAEFHLATVRSERRELREMIDWLERSASKNYPPALYELGRMYRAGHVVPQDAGKGRLLTERAARHGHFFARRELAERRFRCENGLRGIPTALVELMRVFWTGAAVTWKNPYDDRALTLKRHAARDY